MSKSEDYLDNLLNSATSAKKANGPEDAAEKQVQFEQKFLEDFENELLEDDDDGFLLDFEKELETAEGVPPEGSRESKTVEAASDNQSFLDDLSGIVNGAKQMMEETEPQGSAEPLADETVTEDGGASDFMVDTLSDSLDGDELAMMTAQESDSENEQPKGVFADEVDLVSLFDGDEDFAELGEMIQSGNNSLGALKEMKEAEEEEKAKGRKAKKKEKKAKDGESEEKKGFLKKLSRVLFGEDEEEEEADGKKNEKIPITSDSNEIQELSDENMEILAALSGEGGGEAEPEEHVETEEEKKARLKQEKKEAKEKKAQEKKEAKEQKKKEKEKKAKEKKEKKQKKPKEKDNTPPLPKKPVILMFAMSASILLLVILGSNLVNYSSSINIAQKELDSGDYTAAYAEIGGIEIKEEDEELYQKIRILASLQSQYEAYEIFAQYNDFDMALDALICVIGRYDINYGDAEKYGCTVELGLIEQNAENALMEQFGVTAEQAREMYGLRDREDYSLAVYEIIYSLGLQKVAEE